MIATRPGEILYKRHMQAFGLSQNALGRAIGVPPRRINEIIHGKRAITADTAVRLGHFFGNDPAYWMRLQAEYEIAQARGNIGRQLDSLRTLTITEPRPKVHSAAPKAPPPVESRNIKRRILR